MKNNRIKRSMILSVIIFAVVFSFLFYTANFIENRHVYRKKIYYYEQLTDITSNVNVKLKGNINHLEGLVTYIETYPEINTDELNLYIKDLLNGYEESIKDIAILKDTTIVYKYPQEGAEQLIGIDLVSIPDQRDGILKIKNSLETGFVGPINLIEGGQAFISRVPIMVDNNYWGQMTILLDVDYFYTYLESLINSTQLQVSIYSSNSQKNMPIYGEHISSSIDSIQIIDNIYDDTWTIIAYPNNLWSDVKMLRLLLLFLATSISAVVSIFIFFILKTKQDLKVSHSKDSLTGLYSRNYLDTYFKKHDIQHDNNCEFYLINIDINNFKYINDHFGHHVGDKTLIELSNRLNNITIVDFAAFRLAGDEFMVVINQDINNENTKSIYEKIHQSTHFDYKHKDKIIKVSASIGFATYPQNGNNIDELMQYADNQMYIDKKKYHEKVGDQNV